MPARDINFGDVTVHVHGRYISEHSDKEYDLLLKAFLQLGEECDELRSENESLTMQIEDSREDFYELQTKHDRMKVNYDKLLDDYNSELESELDEIYGDEW